MKRTPLVRRTPLTSRVGLRSTPFNPATVVSLSRSRVRAVSPKRRADLARYTQLRADFLTLFSRCQFPKPCREAATEIHHRRGRVGRLLLDVTRWSALCSTHHRWVTENPAESYELGISERRIGGAA